ncbi:peptide MFS transporter [Steroidobacter sp.]|uniref:peptide MFS transporter n=1 Tax=Steroidobacter sp. TaxID=1978227 RepID=UPI001A484B3A|nr:peptide MFS transporter [Steroidobacter sp.]MBL8269829.1 peptide MFS transporter [Steroidobacter sp.]
MDTSVSNARRDLIAPAWFGHPRGLFVVAFTEMWERFSYWGMAGLLVLFLTAPTSSGGWGWDGATALKLYGWYAGLAFVLPVAGGWLANNYWSERRCILVGSIVIALGHLLLAGAILMAAVGLEVATFLAGMALILIGTGLMKPTISSVVTHLYPEGGARRDEGFNVFFVAIYIGAFWGAIVAGYLGERVGWHYGFGAAAVGMVLGLLCYLAKQDAWLGDLGTVVPARQQHKRQAFTQIEKERMRVILVQGLFTVLYAVGFYQMFGMLNLYARDHLDRTILGFEIPTPWLQTINVLSFFVCVPLLAWLWRKLLRVDRNPSASYKLALGIGALAVGYCVLVGGVALSGEERPSVVWLIATYVFFGLGDALVWANQISLTSKLAPERYRATLVGGWYICIGIGTWLTGYVGSLMEYHSFLSIFIGLAVGCLAAAVALAALTPSLRRRMHGAE